MAGRTPPHQSNGASTNSSVFTAPLNLTAQSHDNAHDICATPLRNNPACDVCATPLRNTQMPHCVSRNGKHECRREVCTNSPPRKHDTPSSVPLGLPPAVPSPGPGAAPPSRAAVPAECSGHTAHVDLGLVSCNRLRPCSALSCRAHPAKEVGQGSGGRNPPAHITMRMSHFSDLHLTGKIAERDHS